MPRSATPRTCCTTSAGRRLLTIKPNPVLPTRLSQSARREAAWNELRKGSPDMPPAIFNVPLTLQPWACQATDWWADPLVITLPGDTPRDPDSLLNFVMHSAAHAVLAVRWVRDGHAPEVIPSADFGGIRYWLHSATFRDVANEEFGLVAVKESQGLGYRRTELPEVFARGSARMRARDGLATPEG